MKSKTTDIDQGFASIVEDLKTLSSTSVEVGYYDDGTMADDGSMSMLELASLQLHGSSGQDKKDGLYVPKRNFMDKCANDYEDEISASQQRLVEKVIDKKSFALKGLIGVGEEYAVMMKQTIEDFDSPENTKRTVALKELHGVNPAQNPLVWSGKMRDSIKVKLEESF